MFYLPIWWSRPNWVGVSSWEYREGISKDSAVYHLTLFVYRLINLVIYSSTSYPFYILYWTDMTVHTQFLNRCCVDQLILAPNTKFCHIRLKNSKVRQVYELTHFQIAPRLQRITIKISWINLKVEFIWKRIK